MIRKKPSLRKNLKFKKRCKVCREYFVYKGRYEKYCEKHKTRRGKPKMKLEYVDLKNAIVNLEEAIQRDQTALELNKIVLEKFQEIIKTIPAPFKKKEDKAA
tara:strand:+ start:232 stop:537 length:306 start_codon:yes stop_codon:yes gene_type:complete